MWDREKFREKYLLPIWDIMIYVAMIAAITIIGTGALFVPVAMFKQLAKITCT